jgi:hypothetical protein
MFTSQVVVSTALYIFFRQKIHFAEDDKDDGHMAE